MALARAERHSPAVPEAIYDTIGRTYSTTRRSDPRVAAAVLAALGDAGSVVNVGAGAGSYEPSDRRLIAVEPSPTMVAQRPPGSAPVIRAVAEHLPFPDAAFDASLAILTLHHWIDWRAGATELRRVARRRVVMLTWEAEAEPFWLFDYFPSILDLDKPRFPNPAAIGAAIGGAVEISNVPIPADCADGCCGAWWARPEAYLDPGVRAGISGLAQLDPGEVERGVARLRDDLASGEWRKRHGDVLAHSTLDLGYRLIVCRLSSV